MTTTATAEEDGDGVGSSCSRSNGGGGGTTSSVDDTRSSPCEHGERDHGPPRGSVIPVVYVDKRNAKALKKQLEQRGWIDKRFRMCPAVAVVVPAINTSAHVPRESSFSSSSSSTSLIAIPVLDASAFSSSSSSSSSAAIAVASADKSLVMIEGTGQQYCPYSTAMLGNNSHPPDQQYLLGNTGTTGDNNSSSTTTTTSNNNDTVLSTQRMSVSQSVLLEVVLEEKRRQLVNDDNDGTNSTDDSDRDYHFTSSVLQRILQLDTSSICPSKIEVMGDDRTLVIPSTAFRIDTKYDDNNNIIHDRSTKDQGENKCDENDDSFRHILMIALKPKSCDDGSYQDDELVRLQNIFFERLARAYRSKRIVSRGRVSKDSKVRESGHRLVWPLPTHCADVGIPATSGPDTQESWICVTEQGIRQSFDMTRVMFSRGNISEKIRFGNDLVQPNEIVLDMYAGIGYYTLPAVLKGKAQKVYACEWNPYAAQALQFNVKDNNVEDKVQIFVGDCRTSVQNHNIINVCDRVSLGLLPSSEGGWRTAVWALKPDTGGWLHIHGNVPNKERDDWAVWLCSRLHTYVKDRQDTQEMTLSSSDWVVICTHVERVKSFAPTVSHYVADVFLGPAYRLIEFCERQKMNIVTDDIAHACYGVLQHDSDIGDPISVKTAASPSAPSCALSPNGALSAEWMR